MTRATWTTGAALLALAATLMLSGCGDNRRARSQKCSVIANRAEMGVVARAFAAGKLGTRAQIEHRPGAHPPFTKSGRLKLDGLSAVEEGSFRDWMRHNPVVLGATGRAQDAAFERAFHRCYPNF
jgi:hypothetical protein